MTGMTTVPDPTPPEPPPPKPGWRAVLLGLFVAGQLVYLPLANLMQLVPREAPPEPPGELDVAVQTAGTASRYRLVQESINGLGDALDRWREFSGQAQVWSLFAPGFARQSIFPVVEVTSFDGGRPLIASVRSGLEPDDPGDYFRWPGPSSRLAAYEFLLIVIYWHCDRESLETQAEFWRSAVRDRVRRQQRSLQAYFRWNAALFKKRYGALAPAAYLTLSVKVYPSPAPGEARRAEPFIIPLARWSPDRPPEGALPVEAYDPVLKRFVRLPAEEEAP